MAIQTGTGDETIRRGRTLETRKICVHGPGMAAGVMTALAELRYPVGQKFPVIAAMGGMAGLAIFLDRRMFPEKRPALFRMTFITKLINRSR